MSAPTIEKVPAYCVIINKPLIVSTCPLPKGSCVWRHSITGVCKYDPSNSSDLSVGEIAQLTGVAPPSEAEAVELKEKLFTTIKNELKL